jgi:predicted enzyme related to lactoylglutathione lyase
MTYPELCQIEIRVSDRRRSEQFYAEVLGWKFVPAEILNYSIVDVEPESKFGIALVSGVPSLKEQHANPMIYFKTSDPDGVKIRAAQSGGSLVPAPRKMPGGGAVFNLIDPDGNKIGIYSETDVRPPE